MGRACRTYVGEDECIHVLVENLKEIDHQEDLDTGGVYVHIILWSALSFVPSTSPNAYIYT
jgi:hypothetical protein